MRPRVRKVLLLQPVVCMGLAVLLQVIASDLVEPCACTRGCSRRIRRHSALPLPLPSQRRLKSRLVLLQRLLL